MLCPSSFTHSADSITTGDQSAQPLNTTAVASPPITNDSTAVNSDGDEDDSDKPRKV